MANGKQQGQNTQVSAVASYIKSKISIISAFEKLGIEIKKQGRLYACNCFHHSENTPSLKIYPETDNFHCYGNCGAHGDIISLYQLFHNISFWEAVNRLASDFGVNISQFYTKPISEEDAKFRRYTQTYKLAFSFLHAILMTNPKAQHAREFFEKRKIKNFTLIEFLIGYCPNVETLAKYLKSKGVFEEDIKVLELGREEVFTDAIIYPIRHIIGSYVSCYGRPVVAGSYIGLSGNRPVDNFPLFGLYNAKMHVKSDRRLIAVEGHNDVLSCHSNGIKHVCGMCGGNISDETLAELEDRKLTPIITIPDDDEGGLQIYAHFLDRFQTSNTIKLYKPQTQLGVDPNDLIITDGIDPIKSRMEAAKYPLEHIIDNKMEARRILNISSYIEILKDLLPVVMKLDMVSFDLVVAKLAANLRVSPESVYDFFSKSRDIEFHNSQSEIVVLAFMYSDKAMRAYITKHVGIDFFHVKEHQLLFELLASAGSNNFDEIIVRQMRRENQKYMKIGDEVLSQMLQTDVRRHGLDEHLENVIAMYRKRKLVECGKRLCAISSLTGDDLDESVANATMSISNASHVSMVRTNVADASVKAFDVVRLRRLRGDKIIGFDISRWWPQLNLGLSGIQPFYIVISANQSVGKTAFANNLLDDICIEQKIPALIISAEMSQDDILYRQWAINSGISCTVIRSGAYNDEQEKILWATKEKVQNSPFYIDDDATNDVEVMSSIRYHVGRHGVKIVFVDYIQLLSHHNFRMPRHEQIGDISGRLKKLTKELRIPILPVAQLKQAAEAKDVAEAADVGGAYKIVQDADVVITIKDYDSASDPKPYNRIVRVGKNRFGLQKFSLAAHYDSVCGTLRMKELSGIISDDEIKGNTKD